MVKVIYVDTGLLRFDDKSELYSEHESDCCESHYLSFADLSLSDFEGLEFDISSPAFFEKVDGYGIRLVPVRGHAVSVPGYGYNNGYYSSHLTLVLEKDGASKTKFDISECQDIKDY